MAYLIATFMRIKSAYKLKNWFRLKKNQSMILRILHWGSDCAAVKRKNKIARFNAFMGTLAIKIENIFNVFFAEKLHTFSINLYFSTFPCVLLLFFSNPTIMLLSFLLFF
jgi:hypothetical protein